ncbi:MAG TPA: GDSL-type esterase/lipase family protein, partial [Armatimonadota bacterium]|nr:GDSL-type esterase/lipase family protein [Armatimonadota bacterium]
MKQPTTTAGRLLRAGAVCAGLAGTLLALSAGEAARLVPLPPPDPPRPARGPQVPADADVLGRGIQRTMTLLATSTPQRRNRVRILFYGQSITEQDWSKQVTAKLKERFPHADLEVENRAIGGFASQLLVRPSVHDVAPFYPDLMIFHVYGGNKEYEEIIATTRSRTTAEVLMQTDHVTKWPVVPADPNGDKGLWWDHMMNDVFLPQIAAKYDCGLLDVRTGWLKHLLKEKLEPAALLSDGVHLNDKGNALMAELVGRYLVHRPDLPDTKWKQTVRTYPVGDDLRMRNGKLSLRFSGN